MGDWHKVLSIQIIFARSLFKIVESIDSDTFKRNFIVPSVQNAGLWTGKLALKMLRKHLYWSTKPDRFCAPRIYRCAIAAEATGGCILKSRQLPDQWDAFLWKRDLGSYYLPCRTHPPIPPGSSANLLLYSKFSKPKNYSTGIDERSRWARVLIPHAPDLLSQALRGEKFHL